MNENHLFTTREPHILIKMFRKRPRPGNRQKLTQEVLASLIARDPRTIREWESGVRLPASESLMRLITVFVQQHVFIEGKEREEAELLWEAVSDSFARFTRSATYPPFDDHWFEALMREHRQAVVTLLEIPQPAPPVESGTFEDIWSVPQYRNPFFTGREGILQQMHGAFFPAAGMPAVQVQALSGLAGIGKTQTALEYAYRFRKQYQAILWIAAETRELLTAECLRLATLLHLSERDEADSRRAIALIKRWLQDHGHWLLILDNLEDLTLMHEIVPTLHIGHILVTTREQAIGSFARRRELENLTSEESALLLLHRSSVLSLDQSLEDASPAIHQVALEVASMLDGLPLALDQAGAYIEESGCSVADYLDRYQASRALLLQRRGNRPGLHPLSVTTTFTLSFARLAQQNAQAAEILRLCAFLSPDAIPEEFLIGIKEPANEEEDTPPNALDAVAFDAAIAALRQSSLLRRHSDTRTVSMHRLVQAVLKDQMDEQEQRRWAERAVRIVSGAFPSVERLTTWSLCQRYLPHAYACFELIEQWHLASSEAVRLLRRTRAYLRERAQQAQADELAARAAALHLQAWEPSSQDRITDFFSFMRHAYYQGKYREMGPTIREHMTRLEETLAPEQPERIYLRIGQAFLFQVEGKYQRAEELYQQALTMQDTSLLNRWLKLEEREATGQPHVAFVLSWLGQLYTAQGKYRQAETLFEQSLAIWDQFADLTHIFKGPCLHGFALLLLITCRHEQARDLLEQERAMIEQTLGENHPIMAQNANALAQLALTEGDYTTADVLLRRARAIFERSTGLDHPFATNTFHLWAQVRLRQGNLQQAEELCLQAVQVSEATQGPAHPETAIYLKTLADIFYAQGCWIEAEQLYLRTLAIDEEVLGTDHPHYIATVESYSALLQQHKNRK